MNDTKNGDTGTCPATCYVKSDAHTMDCPNCGELLRADSIDFDAPICTKCGTALIINVT